MSPRSKCPHCVQRRTGDGTTLASVPWPPTARYGSAPGSPARRASGDWSVELPAGCACELCGTLRTFLAYPDRQVFGWPLAKDGRQHIHSRIDVAELPVTHVTKRQGRPYTLMLRKTDALFTGEQEARARDETDLAWLAATRNLKKPSA